MTQLIERNAVFEQYKNIATEISEMQKAFYEEADLGLDDNEQERKEYVRLFDAKNFALPKINKTYKVIAFDHNEIKTYTKSLAVNLKKIFAETGIKNFVVIAHYKMPFAGNIGNKYPPLQKAFKKFETITNDINYSGAIEIDLEALFGLVDIAFWIERCDASGPEYIFFHDTGERLSFNICKHGNVHVIEYEKQLLTEELLKRNGWHLLQERCYDKFSNDGRIKGRRLKI